MEFWAEAFKDLPPLPYVDNVTIVYYYPEPKAFNTDCWEYFDRILTRSDLFPALQLMDIQTKCGPYQLCYQKWFSICASLLRVGMKGLGPCKLLSFK